MDCPMSDGGKGSAQRPFSVDRDTFASNWDRTFSGSGVMGSAADSNSAGSGSAPDSPATSETMAAVRQRRDPGPWKPPPGYKMVYQGGHHNVYCNGVGHIRTTGGWVGITFPLRPKETGRCDCEAYKGDESTYRGLR